MTFNPAHSIGWQRSPSDWPRSANWSRAIHTNEWKLSAQTGHLSYQPAQRRYLPRILSSHPCFVDVGCYVQLCQLPARAR